MAVPPPKLVVAVEADAINRHTLAVLATRRREFFYDFSAGAVVDARPQVAHRYLRMRVRADVFRHVLRHGQPWEEISIGFQARFYRESDAYNFDFRDHFQNHLPIAPPVWRAKSVHPAEPRPSEPVA